MMLLVGMLSAGFSLGVAATLFIFKPDEKGERRSCLLLPLAAFLAYFEAN